MLLRINARSKRDHANDYELIDILRVMSRYDRESVISRYWSLSDLEMWPYSVAKTLQEELLIMFPEFAPGSTIDNLVVEGERLMERSALIHQFESGLFLRIINPAQTVSLFPNYRLLNGPPTFQASNVDLEIRVCEASPYEVVSIDEMLIRYLQRSFLDTELIQ